MQFHFCVIDKICYQYQTVTLSLKRLHFAVLPNAFGQLLMDLQLVASSVVPAEVE